MPILSPEPQVYPEDLFENGTGEPWHVAYVRSRHEKCLARHLLGNRIPYFLPQYERRHRGNGRVRCAHVPLFPGYVFFRGNARTRVAALESNVVVRTLDVLDQARLDEELRTIRGLQREGAALVPHPWLGPGDEVEVVAGPFAGYRGTVSREAGRLRLVVSVTLLRHSVSVELQREALSPARP